MAMQNSVTFVWTLLCSSVASPLILEPVKTGGPKKLALYVPGGLVPPEDYEPMIKDAQKKSSLELWGAIIQCHINLCDAISETNGLLKDSINNVNKSWGGGMKPSDIFIMGHSLGGVGARHFFDGYPGTAGLALFGTQYNGDHEDYKGTLGYPVDLASFPAPLLAITGELDMVPTSHTVELVRQAKSFADKDRYMKVPVILEGMDHSQFCPPFHVKGDLMPEINNDAATSQIGDVLAAWMDNVVVAGSSNAQATLKSYMDKTLPMAEPFMAAQALDKNWCAIAQSILGKDAWSNSKFRVVSNERYDSANLEHFHPSAAQDGDTVTLNIGFYLFYSATNESWPGVDTFLPAYEGAKDISCKMISEDKIDQLVGKTPRDMTTDEVKNVCRTINKASIENAKRILGLHWPNALRRFQEQGKTLTFLEDGQAFAGPQWILTGMTFKESDSQIQIGGYAMTSPVTSPIYPGNHYCKLLAPSKAVEVLMTRGLTKRFTGDAAQIVV